MKLISFTICLMSLILALAILPNAEAQEVDMAIYANSLSFDPEIGEIGQETVISVNITNIGNATAENVRVDFYIKNADGSDIHIGTWQGGNILASENVTASITWTPTNRGVYTIWANIITTSEDPALTENNNSLGALKNYTVDEAPWVIIAIMTGIVIVLVAVFFGMRYFMRATKPTHYPIEEDDLWDGEFSEEVLEDSVGIYIPERVKFRKETEISVFVENLTKQPIEGINIDFSGLDRDFRRDRNISFGKVESMGFVEETLNITPKS
ncbi:MAG: CARDB domain-containing protein, partial [Thermoplasmata archaeon]|nr:CARDB domain-containing protein [Thermoplasmata archaeon]